MYPGFTALHSTVKVLPLVSCWPVLTDWDTPPTVAVTLAVARQLAAAHWAAFAESAPAVQVTE